MQFWNLTINFFKVEEKTILGIAGLHTHSDLINILSKASIAIAIYRGPDYVIESVNQAMCDFWGKSKENVLQKPLFSVLPEAIDQGFKNVFDKVYHERERYEIKEVQVTLQHQDKAVTRYFNLAIEAVENDTDRLIGIAYDVSEQVLARKKIEASEWKYRSLIENTNVATAIYEGPEMRVVLANEAKIKLWHKGNSVIGKPLREILPETQHDSFFDILKQVYETGVPYSAAEDRADLLVDGKIQSFYLNFVYIPLRNEEGKIYGILNMAVDVTPLVEARKKLEEAEEKMRLALMAGNYGIWNFDPVNNILDLDEQSKFLFGIPQDANVTPDKLFNYISERDQKKIREAFSTSLDIKNPKEYNIEFRTKAENPVKWLRSKGKAFFKEGKLYRFTGTVQDISEEKALRDEQHKLLALVDNSVELMSLLKLDNKNSYINKAGMELLGFDSFEQMLETPISELHQKEDFEKVSDEVLGSLKKHGRWSGMMKVKHLKTGEIIPVYNNTIRIDDDETGEILAFGAVMRDMRPELLAQKTLRDSELLFKQYVNGLPVAFYTVDVDGKILLCNEAAVELWGRRPNIGEEFYCGAQKLYKADGTPIQRNDSLIVKTLSTKKAYQGEAIVERPGGERRYVLSYPQPMFNSEGELTGAMNVLVDITDRKRIEDALTESEDKYRTLNNELENRIEIRTQDLKNANTNLQKSNAELEQFAYIASHDLQEPLRKIQIFSDLVTNTSDPEQLKKQISKISAASNRMSLLVKELLNYSRLSSMEYAFEKVDLNSLLTTIKADLEMVINEKNAIINTESLPVIVGIPLQLYQLFLNLMANSLKFCDTTPVIDIKSKIITDFNPEGKNANHFKGNFLHITFSDNGIGFDESQSHKIFTIFQRLNSDPKYSGTGIGLAICKKVVENHHGYISVQSKIGKGTVFHIYLPA